MSRRTKKQILEELEEQYKRHDKLKKQYFELINDKNMVRRDSLEFSKMKSYKELYLSLKERYNQIERERNELLDIIEKLDKQIKPRKHNERGAGRKPKVTKQQKQEIINLYATGNYSMNKICEIMKLGKGTVHGIISKNK